MKKKNVLALAIMMSILQSSNCFAVTHEPSESILEPDVYEEFFETDRKSMILHEKYNNKDAEYTFKKGAKFDIAPMPGGELYYIFPTIANYTDNSLRINVGGELEADGERYEFYLKPQAKK